MNRRTLVGLMGSALLTAGILTTTAIPAAASEVDMLGALQRDLGLTAAQAQDRLHAEERATAIERTLRQRLGADYGGAWYDAVRGKLVVGITDASRAAAVTAAGAAARAVDDTQAELDAAKAVLDAATAPTGVRGWYVDVQRNAVVVEAADTTAAAAQAFAAKAAVTGVDVRTVEAAASRPFYNVRGGDAWYTSQWRCSVGFSGVNSSGYRYMITAGHCTKGAGTAYGYNRVTMGYAAGYTLGSGGDYGRVRVNSSSWTLTSRVNRYGSGDLFVTGSSEAPVGASTCRSGSTTGWRCGTIQAKNQTVYYSGVGYVGGLTKTSACAEGGDSGGSFVSGTQAQGMTSGGSGNCSVGGTTYFSPVNRALSAYGLQLVRS